MYADDTVLYLAGPNVHSLIFYINQDLLCLSEWLEDNNLVLNVSKTKCVLFTSQRHKARDCILNLNLLGKSIDCETTFKYLCVAMKSRVSTLLNYLVLHFWEVWKCGIVWQSKDIVALSPQSLIPWHSFLSYTPMYEMRIKRSGSICWFYSCNSFYVF